MLSIGKRASNFAQWDIEVPYEIKDKDFSPLEEQRALASVLFFHLTARDPLPCSTVSPIVLLSRLLIYWNDPSIGK